MKIRALTVGLFLIPIFALSQTPQGTRGKVASINGTSMTLLTSGGKENVKLASGYKVFSRVPGNLAHVKANSFVGITTVNINGVEQASEIHIFPAALRGLGEGSHMMGTNDASGKPNRMTNGTVQRMGLTKPSRMTNGKIVKETGAGVVVAYKGGSLKISVPPTVSVTEIVPVKASALKVGESVFALGPKQSNGSWLAKTVMIAGPSSAK